MQISNKLTWALMSLGFREATEMSWIKRSEGDELDQDERSLDQEKDLGFRP